ncbi:MAG: ectonucleotide pyrophosphatase/phosphodiesterase, partial [Acidobacteria bacterium]|nr:ectonucleotide pyrophosphatase/phosphodiesterase [Acidobacteriota bacterium]
MSHSVSLKRRDTMRVAFLLLACSIVLYASGRETGSQGRALKSKARRVLVISIDGLDARYLNRRDEYGLKIPNLRRLMGAGATARGVVSVYPSVTYPAHTTIVTGANPARHGIYGNELLDDSAVTGKREWYWFSRYIRAETLWDAARKKGLKVGMVSWPVGVGAGDYNVPEIIRFCGTLSDTLARIKENAIPKELPDEIERRDPALYSKAGKDEQDDMRARMAEYIITEKRPDVMFVHLFDLDHFE